ncbi:MAG: hypothetical protein ABW001_15730 [Mycobacterium sp.]
MSSAVDPDGVHWSVRRRWYPWRRALSLRDLLSATPGAKKAQEGDSADAADAQESTLPRNFLLKVLFVVAAATVWIVYGVGKLLFYVVVVLLFLVGSVIELVFALIVMPIALLLRLIGLNRWPVEIGRQGEHFGTRHARDFAAAGELRNGLLDEIERGVLPADRQAASA